MLAGVDTKNLKTYLRHEGPSLNIHQCRKEWNVKIETEIEGNFGSIIVLSLYFRTHSITLKKTLEPL